MEYCNYCPGYCCYRLKGSVLLVTAEDINRLARHFDLTDGEVRSRYLENKNTFKVKDNGACVLQSSTRMVRRCTVHAARPLQCRQFPYGQPCPYLERGDLLAAIQPQLEAEFMANRPAPIVSVMAAVLTIGHSNVAMGIFLERLAGHAVQVVVDVRSAPYSRHVPHFNKQPLARALAQAGYTYLFLGDRLGGRPDDPLLYDSVGRPDYERLSRRPEFQAGIDRLLKEVATGSRLLLVCGEDNPVTCHRHLLIGRHLELVHGLPVYHLRGDGSVTRCRALFQSRPRQLNLFQADNRNP